MNGRRQRMSSEVRRFAVGSGQVALHLAHMAEQWNYTVSYQHPLRTTNTHLASGETVLTDAPTDNHGLGQAFSPTDLLSTSLAACVATIMGIHVEGKPYDLVRLDAKVQNNGSPTPRVAAIAIAFEIEVSSEASDQDLAVLERVARACPVAKAFIRTSNRTCRLRSRAFNASPQSAFLHRLHTGRRGFHKS